MIGLAGLRGTGKTTLMWQLAEELLRKYPQYPVYFFNVNEITASGYRLLETLEAFQSVVLKKRFNALSRPIILLFDEVHDAEDWAKALKVLYDEARTAFIVCTGSSALLLRQTADLARRMKIERLYPFRFVEFITAESFFKAKSRGTVFPEKGLASDLKQILFFSETADEVYDFLSKKMDTVGKYFDKVEKLIGTDVDELIYKYIHFYNIPAFLFYKDKALILESVFDLFKRLVYEDIAKIDDSLDVDPMTIMTLLMQLAIADEINVSALSQKTGIKREELEKVLDIMEKSELINILPPYGGAESRIWKDKKIFFMSPSLRLSLLSIFYGKSIPSRLLGKLYEDIVVMYLRKTLDDHQILFAKARKNASPDFVVETMQGPVCIEVGQGKTKTNQLARLKKRYGLLVSKGIKHVDKQKNVIKVPLEVFLLL